MQQKLRYRISSWEQANQCLSNNSRQLCLQTSRFLFDKNLEGFLVKVCHPDYGVIFAAMTEGKGYLITDKDESGNAIPFMTTSEILTQLEKFGFIICYSPEVHLDGKQLSMLIDLQHLGYDKLNVIYKMEGRVARKNIIALDSSMCADLLMYNSKVTTSQFNIYLEQGCIYNISNSPANLTEFDWSWLSYVCNIKDILEANAREKYIDLTAPEPPSIPMPFNYEMMSEPAGGGNYA